MEFPQGFTGEGGIVVEFDGSRKLDYSLLLCTVSGDKEGPCAAAVHII